MGAMNIVQKSGWLFNRLQCMSIAEICHRFQVLGSVSLERKGFLSAFNVPSPDLSEQSILWLQASSLIEPSPYLAAADKLLTGKLSIFSLSNFDMGIPPKWNRDPKTSITAPLQFGKSLDYRNEQLVGDIKYLWEPSRHLHLVTLAQAYALSGEQSYLDGIKVQLESWFDQCPYQKGPHWSSSLELGIRLINWSLVWQLIGGVDSTLFKGDSGRLFLDRWLTFIYQHCHFIQGHFSRFSSANNHLIGESAGLFIASVTWPYWPEFSAFQEKAKSILEQEVLRQNAADGVNLEQTVAYQQFVLDFLLLTELNAKANGVVFSVLFKGRIKCMLEFIASIMDVGGNIPMIGDADDGYVVRLSQENDWCPFRSLLASGAVLFNRPDFKAIAKKMDDKSLWLLGAVSNNEFDRLEEVSATCSLKTAFPQGGYYILGKNFHMDNEIKLVVDAGPLGYKSIAAHGHADSLSFTLSVSGHEILIDPGTYAYHTQLKWRNYFRGTSAHNTVCVDHTDQSEIGGNFMWLHKAKTRCISFEQNSKFDDFEGEHDGYLRLQDAVLHKRGILFDKGTNLINVCDHIECTGSHIIQLCWHFSEQCSVHVQNKKVVVSVGDVGLMMTMKDKNITPKLIVGSDNPEGGWVSRRFDHKVPTTTVVWEMNITNNTVFKTQLALFQSVENHH